MNVHKTGKCENEKSESGKRKSGMHETENCVRMKSELRHLRSNERRAPARVVAASTPPFRWQGHCSEINTLPLRWEGQKKILFFSPRYPPLLALSHSTGSGYSFRPEIMRDIEREKNRRPDSYRTWPEPTIWTTLECRDL